MMRRIKILGKWSLVVGLVLSSTNLLQAGTVTWDSTSTANVPDGDVLVIDGACTFEANRTITVTTTDSNATLLQNSSVTSNSAGYTLTINVAAGHTFTFDLTGDYDLSIIGGSGANIFKIYQIGEGKVYFKLNGGRTIHFKGDPDNDLSGTYYFCRMDHKDVTDRVGVYFEYNKSDDTTDNQNAVISLEDGSLFTFSAQTALASSDEEGGIGIIPAVSTDYTGSLLLNIQDHAGFVLTGHLYSAGPTVDLATLAGHQVNMLLKNSATTYKQRFLVVNGNEILSQLFSDPTRTRETVDGVQHGFILGPNSELRLENGTYLDYVGTTTNTDPLISADNELQGRVSSSILKQRNASALTVDGIDATGSVTARIVMEDESGIFFRSACDFSGSWTYTPYEMTDAGLIFTITPTWQPLGAGNIVFDVESALDILGKADATESHVNTINILSREVTQIGGKLEMEGTLRTFPAFTFADDSNIGESFAQYAKGCAFINAHVNLNGVLLRHDDFVHTVNATNTPTVSEPTYIGGDTFVLTYSDDRPVINFFNAELRLHTSAAFTGVDLLVTPTVTDTACAGYIRFYGNGRKLDRGTGRALVLGTTSGSYAYDEASVVDASSYLDVLQKYNNDGAVSHELSLTTTANDHYWIEQIAAGADLSSQYSIQTLFLGNASDIQIGSQSTQTGVTLTNSPVFRINGNFFSLMSQGGSIGQPELSATTGEGGIFVDRKGVLTINSSSRANFGCMVVKGSADATINLPKSRSFFADRVGISFWDLDLSLTQTVITSLQSLSDFTLDWMATLKDYDGGFVPFDPTGTLTGSISYSTLYNIPVVCGEVDEFQVKRSRLGDQVHLLVDGGKIRSLVFLKGYDSSEAQTGLVVVKNNALVGLGNNSTRRDTLEANVVLGINGVTIGAQGDGVFQLNTDVTINNYCPILAGPDFASTSTQKLYIRSDDPHFVRVKNGGVLDLSSFTSANHQIVFDGKVQLIFEPGAQLILSSEGATEGGAIIFDNQAQCTFEPLIDTDLPAGTTVASTDDFRAKIIGTGTIQFKGNSSCTIYKDAYVGIESDATYGTSLYLKLNDNAKMSVGSSGMFGGALQIGNTADLDTTVTVTLEIDGSGALLEIGSQGFIGIGAGIVDKRSSIPDEWYIGRLYNLSYFNLDVDQGTVKHDRIMAGNDDSALASLLAVGPADYYDASISIDVNENVFALGGGNMYLVTTSDTKIHPVVSAAATAVNGLLSSGYMFLDGINTNVINGYGPAFAAAHDSTSLFNLLRIKPEVDQYSPQKCLTLIQGKNTLGSISGTSIVREPLLGSINSSGVSALPEGSMKKGSAAVLMGADCATINAIVVE